MPPAWTRINCSDPLRQRAPIANIMDASGNALGLQPGDTISINGEVGGKPYRPQPSIIRVRKPCRTYSIQFKGHSIFLKPTDPPKQFIGKHEPRRHARRQYSDGSIAIRGQKETAFALQNLSISANNSNQDATAPTALNANMATTASRRHAIPRSSRHQSSSMTNPATRIRLRPRLPNGTPGEWLWQINTQGGEKTGGNTGKITFGQDGSPSSFTLTTDRASFPSTP